MSEVNGTLVAVSEGDLPSPDFNAPWMDLLSGVGGWIIATVLVCLVALMVIGILTWIAGKLGAGGRAQDSGIGVFAWGAIGAILIGVAATLVAYSTDIGPEWMNFDAEQHVEG